MYIEIVKKEREKGTAMTYFAIRNAAVCGYKIQSVAFNKKSERDEFLSYNSDFEKIAASKMDNKQGEKCREYANSIFDESGNMLGCVLFTFGNEYYQTAWF